MTDTTTRKQRDASKDQDWSDLADQFQLRSDTIYLNHGSFGLPPDCVRNVRRQWIDRLDEQPMDFYLRQLEPALVAARTATATFVGTSTENLVFVDNATYGMNVVAHSFALCENDEVLISDHEYGAVNRIWQRACDRVGANLVIAKLPEKFESHDQVVDSCLAGATDKTRLLVISHITSATALIMPVKQICKTFAERGIAVCIDGPHAPVQVNLSIDDLDCDFYTASCHKWLCATLGTGFLYVNPRQHETIQPPIRSWGRLRPAVPQSWDQEFTWLGSRDPSACLSISTAIKFFNEIGMAEFRNRSRWLATYAESRLCELFATVPIANRNDGWYGSMAHVPLPPGDWSGLQKRLWEQFGIEVMVLHFNERWFTRVSGHLYNDTQQIDTLIQALATLTKT